MFATVIIDNSAQRPLIKPKCSYKFPSAPNTSSCLPEYQIHIVYKSSLNYFRNFRNKVSILYFVSEVPSARGLEFSTYFTVSCSEEMAGRQKRQSHSIENLLRMPSTSRKKSPTPGPSSRLPEGYPPKKVGL